MTTTYELKAICDQCKKIETQSGTVEESVELWQVPDGWFRSFREKTSSIFCSIECLYEWVRINEGEEALKSLQSGVWLA